VAQPTLSRSIRTQGGPGEIVERVSGERHGIEVRRVTKTYASLQLDKNVGDGEFDIEDRVLLSNVDGQFNAEFCVL